MLECVCWGFEYKHYAAVSSHWGFWGSSADELRTLRCQGEGGVPSWLVWKWGAVVAVLSCTELVLAWALDLQKLLSVTRWSWGTCVNLMEHCCQDSDPLQDTHRDPSRKLQPHQLNSYPRGQCHRWRTTARASMGHTGFSENEHCWWCFFFNSIFSMKMKTNV